MDIEIVIKKAIVYTALMAMITFSYFSIVYFADYVFRGMTGFSSLWITVPAIALLAVLFQPARERVEHWVNKNFFRYKYDYQIVLGRYAKTLRRPTTDLNRFLKIAPYLVSKSMQLDGAGALVLNRQEGHYEMRTGQGAHKGLGGAVLEENSEIVKHLIADRGVLLKDELMSKLKAPDLPQGEKEKLEGMKAEMERLKASLLIPSVSESEYFKEPSLIAIFVFGHKLSEDPFTREDLDFLRAISRQASITIEYAFILEELRRDEEKIVQTEKFAALGVMAGSVVGALKGPITSMESYSLEMTKRFGDPAFREGFVEDIPRDIMRLDKVVNDLLIYARPMKLELSHVKLNDLVSKAVNLLRIKEAQRHVEVKTGLSELPVMTADPQLLLNAILRLFAFSIASAPKEIWIATGHEGQKVFLSVAIPGAEIPAELLPKIFSLYHSPREGEPGLDLATSSKIFREHGGDITAESDPVRGVKFTVSLPVEAQVAVKA